MLALLAAGLLILAFPDFEFWFLAWVALVPLMWAVERQSHCVAACFTLGWLFGTAFFFGTCWWLTYAPIHYAAIPWPIAYLLIFVACLGAGIFPGIFALVLAVLIRRFGSWAFLAAPFVWVFSEFLRYWFTGNNWNALGHSQALNRLSGIFILWTASLAGHLFVSWLVAALGGVSLFIFKKIRDADDGMIGFESLKLALIAPVGGITLVLIFLLAYYFNLILPSFGPPRPNGTVVALQPNVPMSGLDQAKLVQLRQRQIDIAETEIKKLSTADRKLPTVVILPESPMNFMYNDDREFQRFIGDFARRNNVSVLFNSAEPDVGTTKYFNSAVMVGPDGREVSQYDKIYLLPFGEAVPPPLETIVPGFVGNFAYGREYDLLPVGDAKAGVMICFESHFGQLSREYVRNGADVIIEMTNDGYLGPTPVLRQHLANAVFRAVETNRPVLRVTNVGITAYITENGQVLDAAPTYQEATRTWSVSKSDGSQTFYVKYGDWFAWLCTAITAMLLILCARKKPIND